MPERDIRKALKARVEAYGGEVRAVSWLGRRNAPDVLCLFDHGAATFGVADAIGRKDWRGFNVWVEAKAPKKGPTAAQHREHNRMRGCGCEVVVISTLEQLDNWLPPRA